ncbi:hypothetical protein CO661_33190 [Sinorhizobium fredii]|uniref:Uncharacterized protein n=1 Tax=Rhizobium fredii TaxID=380 RepID=A0A2A6LN99_RHIFR|nr:hypothetical protein CO661_33190 [Sinorhizobium fredii]
MIGEVHGHKASPSYPLNSNLAARDRLDLGVVDMSLRRTPGDRSFAEIRASGRAVGKLVAAAIERPL